MRTRSPDSPHAAFEHRCHVQLLTNGPKVVALAFEVRTPRCAQRLKALELREGVENFFGDAVAEPILILRRAHVGESH